MIRVKFQHGTTGFELQRSVGGGNTPALQGPTQERKGWPETHVEKPEPSRHEPA